MENKRRKVDDSEDAIGPVGHKLNSPLGALDTNSLLRYIRICPGLKVEEVLLSIKLALADDEYLSIQAVPLLDRFYSLSNRISMSSCIYPLLGSPHGFSGHRHSST